MGYKRGEERGNMKIGRTKDERRCCEERRRGQASYEVSTGGEKAKKRDNETWVVRLMVKKTENKEEAEVRPIKEGGC